MELDDKNRYNDDDGWRWYVEPTTGLHLPSVTTILEYTVANKKLESWFQNTKKSDIERVRKSAADHGTAVHAYIEQLLTNPEFDWSSVRPEHRGSVAAFVGGARDHNIKAETCEKTVFSLKHGFAGSVDFIGWIDDNKVIADWKITKSYKITNGWQLGAYRLAHQEMSGESLGLVGLQVHRTTGDLKLYKYEHLDFVSNAFLHTLEIFKALYFNKLNSLGYKWLKHDGFTNPIRTEDIRSSDKSITI